jgi:hypothetical protein
MSARAKSDEMQQSFAWPRVSMPAYRVGFSCM